MPQKVAIYIRVSTQEQVKEGYSIEAQTERLTAYCKAKSWAIYDVYTDAGFSGSNTQRPALQQLFADIDAGHADCVLVYKLDRLSRSQKDTLYMIEDVFLSHNVDFVSMQENFDTSSSFGRAMIGILSVFAQLEREQIRERVTMGRAERAKAGLWHGGGYRPYGYDYVDGHLVVNAVEAVMVREVFDLFLNKTPINAIAGIIDERYGRSLGHSGIRSMLDMKLYLGLISWEGNTYEGEHEPIIDEVTFKRAQVLRIVGVLRHQSHSLSNPETFSRDLCAAPTAGRAISQMAHIPDTHRIKNIDHTIFVILGLKPTGTKSLTRTARTPPMPSLIWMRGSLERLSVSHMTTRIFKSCARKSVSGPLAPTRIARHSCSASMSSTVKSHALWISTSSVQSAFTRSDNARKSFKRNGMPCRRL